MKRRGRLLVEFALTAGLAAFMLSGAIKILRLGREHQVLMSAARLGTLLQSRSGVAEETARAEVVQYLAEEGMGEVVMSTGRYLDTASARFYTLVRTRLEKGILSADVICEQEEP